MPSAGAAWAGTAAKVPSRAAAVAAEAVTARRVLLLFGSAIARESSSWASRPKGGAARLWGGARGATYTVGTGVSGPGVISSLAAPRA
ncbi:hypothetical protein GCM10010299_24750 [Streptomyces tanashiensis]|nr:hypothetical protein GCM10010299_24750 [Streptomyces tanashiensis]